ncbi:MAG: hypothetical protein ACTHME_10325 [Candidatus Nitrosocosmicus sp.]
MTSTSTDTGTVMSTIEKGATIYKMGSRIKYLKCITLKMKKVYLFVAMAIVIPMLMTTSLNYNIQTNSIQVFAQTNNNNTSSDTTSPKDIVNMATSGQKVVLRGIESSKIFNNATINTGEKPQGISILTNLPDGTIYSGTLSFTATKPVEVGISYRLPVDNNTYYHMNTKTLGDLYLGYHHNDKGEAGTPGILSAASVIVPDYGTHSPYFSASIPFVGDSLWLKTLNGEPFIVAYAVSADIVKPLNVVNLVSSINATKGITAYSSR